MENFLSRWIVPFIVGDSKRKPKAPAVQVMRVGFAFALSMTNVFVYTMCYKCSYKRRE